MHHGIGFHGGYALLIVLALAGAVALIAPAVLLSRKDRSRETHAQTRETQGEPPALKQQLLTFLRQRGGPVFQGEIRRQLDADPHEIARLLQRLEEEQLIERYWQPEQSDYVVTCAG